MNIINYIRVKYSNRVVQKMTDRKGRARCEGRLPAKMTYVENCFEMKLKNGKWKMANDFRVLFENVCF